jgi:hypothetical protein
MIRRKLHGRPLLVASTGVLLATGCPRPGGPNVDPVGNLMAPVERQSATLCVDVLPEGVQPVVQIEGIVTTERCVEVLEPGPVHVQVAAPGYLEQRLEVPFSPVMEPLTVTLELDMAIEAPVGNLMAPQDPQ